jgi:hypothetical protein
MLINLSNHPSQNWSINQLSEARNLFGEVIDIPFPQIDPNGDEDYICAIADKYFLICKEKIENSSDTNSAVHLMGELNFLFVLANKFLKSGIKCVASTTERNSIEKNGVKISEFKFIRFREYKLC